jgi:phosphoserine aminotransferase
MMSRARWAALLPGLQATFDIRNQTPDRQILVVSADNADLFDESNIDEILFLSGGASTQFFMVPMNLLKGGRATYLDTGTWSAKAVKEAKRFGSVDVPFKSWERVPEPGEWGDLPEGTAYLHYTANNTVVGSEFHHVPRSDAPLVVDASSNILSREWNDADHALIYAGAQKNLGPAGVTIVAIRKDLLAACATDAPTMLRYPTHAEGESMYNTPPTFPIFVVERVAAWIEAQGGLSAIGARNQAQADRLYAAIDRTGFYRGKVDRGSRSRMNVTFTTGDDTLDATFVKAATAADLSGLKGHRSVGGLRASIYNACPDAAVDALIDFMRDFEQRNG